MLIVAVQPNESLPILTEYTILAVHGRHCVILLIMNLIKLNLN